MTIQLDHFIVPSRNKNASAGLLADLLGLSWAEAGEGPFAPVYMNDSLTLDFMDAKEPVPFHHYCFRVSEAEFDSILDRIKAADIKYRSEVLGPVDMKVNTRLGGKNIYWNEPDGHQWEILTASYARPQSPVA